MLHQSSSLRQKTKQNKNQSPLKDVPPRVFIYTHLLKEALEILYGCTGRIYTALYSVMSPSWNIENSTSPKEPLVTLPSWPPSAVELVNEVWVIGGIPWRMLRGSGSNFRLTSDLWGGGGERETAEGKVLLQITPSFWLLAFVTCAIKRSRRAHLNWLLLYDGSQHDAMETTIIQFR